MNKNNKFLLVFGLFLLLGNLANWALSFLGQDNLPDFIKQLSDSKLFLISVVLFFLSFIFFRAQAGIIACVKALLDKKETSFALGFKTGRLFFWRLLAVAVIMNVCLFVLSFIISAPVYHLYLSHFLLRASILAVLGLMILIPLSILIRLMGVIAPMFVVLFDLRISEAIQKSFELAKEFWARLLVFGLLMFIMTFAALFLGLFVFLAYFVYHRGGATLNFGLMIGLMTVGSIIFLVVQTFVLSFQQTAWVLTFLELVKPQKFEEEEPMAVADPEVVS